MTTDALLGRSPAPERVVPGWELCDRMRRSLRLVDLSNQEVADHVGVRRETVSTWLTGKRRPSGAVLRVWADLTGVDYEWLRTGEAPTDDGEGLRSLPRLDSNQQPSGYPFALVIGLRDLGVAA